MPVDITDIDPELVTKLRHLAEYYGTAGVAQAARLLASPAARDELPAPTPPRAESDGDTLSRLGTNAMAWSQEAAHRSGNWLDQGTLLGWFANAIEAGRTAGRREMCPHPANRRFAANDLQLCAVCGLNLSQAPA